jgi:hypothetical protein
VTTINAQAPSARSIRVPEGTEVRVRTTNGGETVGTLRRTWNGPGFDVDLGGVLGPIAGWRVRDVTVPQEVAA